MNGYDIIYYLTTLDGRWSTGARTIKIVLGIKSMKSDPFLENAIRPGH